jgi:CRP/FNR family transcriptional regulator, cyclic AMP receptor protein
MSTSQELLDAQGIPSTGFVDVVGGSDTILPSTAGLAGAPGTGVPELEQTIDNHSNILARLPDRLSSHLFARATRYWLAAGETLFRAGEDGDGCYLLDKGVLKVSVASPQGDERILAIIRPDSIVGELAIIDGQPRSASVIAVRDCELSFISRAAFKEYTQQHPEIYRYLVDVLASRLRETNDSMAAASFLPVKARVARTLLELAKYLGQDAGSGRILIRHKINQGDLAAMAGVARENVSRVLSKWKRQKIVTRWSFYYTINNIATLERELES